MIKPVTGREDRSECPCAALYMSWHMALGVPSRLRFQPDNSIPKWDLFPTVQGHAGYQSIKGTNHSVGSRMDVAPLSGTTPPGPAPGIQSSPYPSFLVP